MSDYKGVVGTAILSYAGDVPNVLEGQVWYNSTATNLKFQYAVTATAWSTGNSMGTARDQLAGAGIQTAALAFGGRIPSPTAITESYNGTNWTEVNDLNTARLALAGSGTSTAALAFGGASAATEEWNVGPATITFTDS